MTEQIPTADGRLEGHLSVPYPSISGAAPWPGVVVVHDAFGLNQDTKNITDRFASAGYLAIAPDLYSRGGFARCVRSVFGQLSKGSGRAFEDIEAARELLASRSDCTGAVGVAGFCMGGGFALLAAPRGFQAAAPYYGQVPSDAEVLAGSCPVVASFGGKDPTLRGAADKLDSQLTELGVPHDVKEYPEAGHSFANQLPVGPFGPLTRVLGFGYHHESSEDAWQRVRNFFAEHLS
ncbi:MULTISPECIES: dienelactone hydrolase family protein [unclassified Saccharopolyspora]|uniref:dienelactone hydrolase family protein n=1 Tax=Saccharopolyspora TaxID=1835 RepID=UPI00190C4315|nr:dienelactone hydrolase family protein [Saccharopolyspora sp. HNM0986]MBK0866944.1 dienelactone hydrolase family protein [Saccharopolyspora sp. HNM0986]